MESNTDINAVFDGFKQLSSKEAEIPWVKDFEVYIALKHEEWSIDWLKKAFDDLSIYILRPHCTYEITACFPRFVVLLLLQASNDNYPKHHQLMCVAFSKLIPLYPDVLKYSLIYFQKKPPPWISVSSNSNETKRRKLSEEVDFTDLDLAKCCYGFLQYSADHFRSCWNWSVFIEHSVKHENCEVRWMVCQCVAVISYMNETEKNILINNYLTDDELRMCILKYNSCKYNDKHFIGFISSDESDCDETISNYSVNKVTESVISVAGVTLPLFNANVDKVDENNLILVPSTLNNLRNIALGVAIGKPICLTGPVGCGKTALIEFLATVTGRIGVPELLKVQLGEETDAKMLLGGYCCSETPGEFIWQPGALTRAAMEGHWLILEDIDSASSDVAAVLSSMLETGILNVPGFRDSITVAPGFQLFVTYRSVTTSAGEYKKQTTATELLNKLWLQITIEPLSEDELVTIVQRKFPVLNTVATRFVSVFLMFSSGSHESSSQDDNMSTEDDVIDLTILNGRLVSVRDLLKWCVRSVINFDVSSKESALKVLQDAIDIFCCSISDSDKRVTLAGSIAVRLGIVKTKADYFINAYKPVINFSLTTCGAGRVNIHVKSTSDSPVSLDLLAQTKFALTRPSCCLLERLAVAISQKEPVLLVGETGTGKTSTLQLLAKQTGNSLVVLNMNQQSDSADLLGGFKPVDMKYVLSPLREEFEILFRNFFSVEQNIKFLEHISSCFNAHRWSTLLRLMEHSQTAAIRRLSSTGEKERLAQWLAVGEKIYKLKLQIKQGQAALAFSFIEGALVKALKNGCWVLLDEINLASAETLQCLSGLLEGGDGSVSLLEKGEFATVTRHPDFRLLAAMNPATDVGKKDLPPGIRNRFTELFVDELNERTDLGLLVSCYLPDLSPARVDAVVMFYLKVKTEAMNVLADPTGHRPHYSLRTLCRALAITSKDLCSSIQRSLYEALCLSFLTQLDSPSHNIVKNMISEAVVDKGDIKSILGQSIPEPLPTDTHVQFEDYWVTKGSLEPHVPEKYILTPCVRRNLRDVVRTVSLSNHPILIQGDTSVGKTSLITYLAQASGNKCLRINNHEHTDLQEYIGSYCVDPTSGNLVFKEGVLVEAMRQGYWIILDELNLAPTDVLEALNRVLDDNRELYIPETQQTVKADNKFRLFATQNPPGLYGGRKILSRAFRNRFVELHFDEIPPLELETILQQRCDMPASYCKKLVAVMNELQMRRRGSAAFAGKQGFITLRDLFRWGERYRLATQVETTKYYDWDQHIADEGFLVLAGRVRKQEEKQTIIEVIKKHIKRKVDPQRLFTLNDDCSPVTRHILEALVAVPLPSAFKHVVWTYSLREIAVLVGKAYEFHEPVLLVGETGCGKTTVAQLLANINGQKLLSLNCHQNSESADFLGGLRPVRDHSANDSRLFEWIDGPLVEAMKHGHVFLADELSLADDSVLERLNSLLEPERKILLSEKGTDVQEVVADDNFLFIGTMNPGGDFGKKELSPALRNRLTEIWCDGVTDHNDMISIIEHNVQPGLSLANQEDGTSGIGHGIVNFINWFKTIDIGVRHVISIRDVLTWVQFINTSADWGTTSSFEPTMKLPTAYVFGACVILIDGLGTGAIGLDSTTLYNYKKQCLTYLVNQMKEITGLNLSHLADPKYIPKMTISADSFLMGPLSIQRGRYPLNEDPKYLTYAETVKRNIWRVIQSLQLPRRAILLEGSPGVGKSSLVTNLARLTGHNVTRINLSEQTDVSDLFGADLPVEGAPGGVFAWRDGPFLRALKNGNWILLDELNLASQSILESLNAVLDHRGELFISELGRSFAVQSDQTKLFACQNPQRQGGARKGLPKSFLNRFTKVYVEPFSDKDLKFIISCIYRSLPTSLVDRMVKFSCALEKECNSFKGGPWEMNLRDLTRWAESICNNPRDAGRYALLIYANRMRSEQDKQKVIDLYKKEFGSDYPLIEEYNVLVTRKSVLFGDIVIPRIGTVDDTVQDDSNKLSLNNIIDKSNDLIILRSQIQTLHSVSACIKNNWMAILIGAKGTGKTSVVRLLAQLCGQKLQVLAVNSAMDTSDIVGGFEQADWERRLETIVACAGRLLRKTVRKFLLNQQQTSVKKACGLLRLWESYQTKAKKCEEKPTLSLAVKNFNARLAALKIVLENLEQSKTVTKLIDDINVLQNAANQDCGLNTGGSFEWVDSILVKCLQEGHWLLIDNANLCSPAVLDRLNGLLEPNGELVLGERGVTSNGQLHSIKPHPQFRLFLTMDPRYGEISRAMRNRGVEIYLLESEKGNIPRLDLKALLDKSGIKNSGHQEVLLEIHDAVKHLTQGPEQPNINQLLHAASLIMQQWIHGQSLKKSFKTACKDVYIKNQNSLAYHQKNKINDTIDEILLTKKDKLSKLKSTLEDFIDCKITTFNVQQESSLYMLQWQGTLLSAVIKTFCTSDKELCLNYNEIKLKDMFRNNLNNHEFNEKYLDIKLIDLIPNLLVYFYTCVSRRNVPLQNSWLKNIVDNYRCDNSDNVDKKNDIIDLVTNVSSELELKLKEFLINSFDFINTSTSLLEQGDLPWDARRLPSKYLPKTGSYVWSGENKIIALMNFIVHQLLNETAKDVPVDSDEKKTLKWQTMSVIEYSTALKEGRLSDLIADEPIISELSSLLSSLDSCITTLLKSNLPSLSTSKFYSLLSAFNWRHRIFKIGEMTLFKPPANAGSLPQVSENVKTLLALHYKWISKWLLPLISDLIKSNSSLSSLEEVQLLMRTLSDIEKSLYKCTSPLLSLAKKVRQISGQPLPLVSSEEAKIALLWDKLSRDSSFSKPCLRKLDFENRVAWSVSPEGRKCRILLLQIKSLLLNGQDLKQASDLLEEAQSLLKESQLLSEQQKSSTTTQKKIKAINLPEIKLWPIHDLISLKLNTVVRKYLIENSSIQKNQQNIDNETMEVDDNTENNDSSKIIIEAIPRFKLNEAFCKWTNWLQTFPPGILALVNKVTNQEIIDKPIAYHQHVASVLLEQFNKSTAVKNSDVWLNWCITDEKDEENLPLDEYIQENKELRNILSPLLSLSVVSLLLPDSSNAASMVSLRAHQDRSVLLNTLKTTLWRNISVLSTQQLNYLKNEESCVKTSFENFTNALECSLQSKGYLSKSNEEMEVDSAQDETNVLNRISNGLSKLIQAKDGKKSWYTRPSDANDPIEALPQTLSSVFNSLNELNSINDDIEKWILIGQSWAYLGLTQLILFSCIEIVDSVHKNALKLQYAIEEREYLERILCVENVQCIIEGRSWFPFKKDLIIKCENLLQKEDELKKFVAVRPDPPLFSSLIKELLHASRSLCSAGNVRNIIENLVTCFYQWDKQLSDKILNETKMWLQSIDTFTSKFSSDFGTWYPDITTPILVAIAQIKYGIQLMLSTVRKITVKQESAIENSIFSLDTFVSLLGTYPLPTISSALQLIGFCTSDISLKLLKAATAVEDDDDNAGVKKKESERNETFRLAKFCLEEIQNIVKIKGNLNEEWLEICRILDFVVLSWEHQEEERKQKLLAEESLYVNKPRIKGENLTEEEETELEIMQIFNSNRDNDFSDLEQPATLENVNKSKIITEPENKFFKLTLQDIQAIHRIHFELVYENTNTHWWMMGKNDEHELSLNFTSSFLERFTVFKILLHKFGEACNIDLDIQVSPGLCLATEIASLIGHCENTEEPIKGKHYDFYNDPHVSEAKQSISLLNKLTERVEELRSEWPDHPTLNQIMVIVNRVMDFEATSPLSRFLTGLELLMSKMREWEENAHSGVSLASHMTAFTQKVIAWRKLELTCWKGCLLATRNRLKGEVSKWWFYLYSLVAGFLRSKSGDHSSSSSNVTEVVTENDLIIALQKFMEKSTLVQFTSRLQLLLNFHCHAANLTASGHYELTNIFWNLFQYYKQFKDVIEHHIQELSVNVEKKLKDFVKIARWNEIGYWSVKENVDRNYRTLHKYIKEYEIILNEPAINAMTKIEYSNKQQVSSIVKCNPDYYITEAVFKVSNEEKKLLEKGSILSKDLTYLKKAKHVCKTIIQNISYSNLIQTIDEFAGEIVTTAQQLDDLEVDRTLPKDKQKSQAKNILQQKRKSLSDLFKMLADIGLNYKTGLLLHSSDSASLNDHFILPPADLENALKIIHTRSADNDLLGAWSYCEKYFWVAVARAAQLQLTSQHPHKELGPPNVERCRGFTTHLMKLTVGQKKLLTESLQYFYLLKCQSVQLNEIEGTETFDFDKNEEEIIKIVKMELPKILNDSVYYLEQFNILLEACPVQKTTVVENEIPLTISILDNNMLGPMLNANKGDYVWENTKTKLSDCIKVIKEVKTQLNTFNCYNKFINNLLKGNPKIFKDKKINNVVPINLITNTEYIEIQKIMNKLNKFIDDIKGIKNAFDLNINLNETCNPFIKCFNDLSEKIENISDIFVTFLDAYTSKSQMKINTDDDFSSNTEILDYRNKIETLMNKILVSIQEIYKKYKDNIASGSDSIATEEDEEESAIKPHHLRKEIIGNLYSDISVLNLKDISFEIQSLIELLDTEQFAEKKFCRRLLKHCGPIFDQYVLLTQFIMTHQLLAFKVSSKLCLTLLGLFIDLTEKGFRTPEDLLDELEAEGEESVSGGMGLGEGEGQKDVSDQIESQDQLEDANPKGEKHEEEDRDCKEEEKGIEMSDDFSGKLQDVEKEDDENESNRESDKEEEPDKEMGETEKGAEILDQQVWGSDSEDDVDENDKDWEKEEGNRGEQIGEKEWGAQEEGKKEQEDELSDDSHKDCEQKNKEINEMEDKNIDDNQIDPYHGHQQPEPEPEPLDLPEDLQLDDGEAKDQEEQNIEEENPFDVDKMKERNEPDKEEGGIEEEKKDEDKSDIVDLDSSDGENEESNQGEEQSMNVEEQDDAMAEEENKTAEDGGKKDEDKTGEEPKSETEDNKEDEIAKPSEDTPSEQLAESAQQAVGSKDQVTKQSETIGDSKELQPEDTGISEGSEKEGVGQAQNERESHAGQGGSSTEPVEALKCISQEEKRRRPGDTEDDRALGDVSEPLKKKIKTMNAEDDQRELKETTRDEGIKEDNTADLYQHVSEANKMETDIQVMDAATKEQTEKQSVPNKLDEPAEEMKDDDDDDVVILDEDEYKVEDEFPKEKSADKLPDNLKDCKDGQKSNADGKDKMDIDSQVEIEGEVIQTESVARTDESTFHTKWDELHDDTVLKKISANEFREQLVQKIASWIQPATTEEASDAWNKLNATISSLASELSEQLRLVLEPTTASRLKGDFKTGRRINMRKVIPYIASQFRKDKIWLRRTKPSKRDYQIILAIDDSSSMADNHSKELAFESLALVSKALTLLEVGKLGVISFGEIPKMLHSLDEPFTEHKGARLLQQLVFNQQKTNVGSLVDYCCDFLMEHKGNNAQLLVIVSDGRGIFNEGESKVRAAVRRARLQGIFMVFIIIDNPQNKDSILDIRMPKFSEGKLLEISSYMDNFPFPFYLILRDITGLPLVLSDALRQWFELVTNLT
ncbi:midasin [Lycorma delicatula]|uniref:midasin n=1 Tax=Lycorma delicatula TaxID=130591 RepID=UPI003F50ED15